ncbi:DUF2523 domain-containing protein [Acinetobacter sp. ANC 5659]|uniref:DUF2523 domain-containing protein n=1 Tax=Acinetobacter higginsii TaxID=70347 RepID=UPI0002D03DB5|nr:DUF2523 domain-containing protein [Acinetobacter higginsii]ENX58647.1 hypothetical protein F885_03003 [Acinetobacter higginsii]MCH7320226.1 DUF2523 domain-containing protein [Acinetobacter higginsii]
MQYLFMFGAWLLSNFAKKVLLGAGVAIVSTVVIQTILTSFINKAINASNSIDHTYLGLLAISGLDQAISIVIGALITRATIVASEMSFKKLT